MTHLFVTDLDGTLLGPDSLVSEASAGIITSLTRRGAHITVATARTPATVVPLLSATETSLPAIVMTGAAMWDREANRYIDPILLTPDAAGRAMAEMLRGGLSPFVYRLDAPSGLMTVYHPREMNEAERRFYDERKLLELKRFELDSPAPYTRRVDDAVLLFAMGERRMVERVAATLSRDAELSVSAYGDIFDPTVGNLEIFAAGVSKASAVKRLAARIGAERITVYGDNLNDLPMMSVATDSVAVANAQPEVLARASRIIGPNAEDAVARDMLRCVAMEA